MQSCGSGCTHQLPPTQSSDTHIPQDRGSGGTARGAAAPEQIQVWIGVWMAMELLDGVPAPHRAPEGRPQSQGVTSIPHSPSEPAGISQTQPSRKPQLLSCLWECLLQLHRHQRLREVCKSQHYQGCNQLLLMMPLWNICSAFCHHTQSGFGNTAAPAQPHKQDLTLPGWNSAFDQVLGDSSTPRVLTQLHREGPNWKIQAGSWQNLAP